MASNKFEYLVKGFIHAGILNPWPVSKEGTFEEITGKLNKLGEDGWEVVSAYEAGNADRGIYVFKRVK